MSTTKSKLMSNTTCSCCDADITAPQFYKGKAYGWSCVTKVSGRGFKRVRDSGYWIKADSVEVIVTDKERLSLKVRVTAFDGLLTVSFASYLDADKYRETGEITFNEKFSANHLIDGFLKITETKKHLAAIGDDRYKSTRWRSVFSCNGSLYKQTKTDMVKLIDHG